MSEVEPVEITKANLDSKHWGSTIKKPIMFSEVLLKLKDEEVEHSNFYIWSNYQAHTAMEYF